MGQIAEGDAVHAGLCHALQAVEADAARCFAIDGVGVGGFRHVIAQFRLWKQNLAKPHTASEYENRNLLECSLAVAQVAYRRRQNIRAYFNSDC